MPRMTGIEKERRGTGSNDLVPAPEWVLSKKTKHQKVTIRDGTSSALDSLGYSFDSGSSAEKIMAVYSVIKKDICPLGIKYTFLFPPLPEYGIDTFMQLSREKTKALLELSLIHI